MTVAIISGRGGTGKTSQLITLVRLFSPTRWAIMEKKDERALKSLGFGVVDMLEGGR